MKRPDPAIFETTTNVAKPSIESLLIEMQFDGQDQFDPAREQWTACCNTRRQVAVAAGGDGGGADPSVRQPRQPGTVQRISAPPFTCQT